MKRIKKILLIIVLSMMFTSAAGSTLTVYAKKINYSKRVKKAKKNLIKKVKKMAPEAYSGNPLKRVKFYVKITKSKRNGRYLTCTLKSNWQKALDSGWPEEVGVVKVDLNTGVVKIIHSRGMFDSLALDVDEDDYSDDDWDPYTYEDFKIKVK